MKIIPTEVKFDEKSYTKMVEDIEKLESEKKEAKEAYENLRQVFEYFVQKLSEVADVSQMDIKHPDYEIFIANDISSDRVRMVTRKSNR